MKKLFGIFLVCVILVSCFTGCLGSSSDANIADNDNNAMTGTIYPITRESGSGTRSAFSELFEIVDTNGNDAITETAETTSSTSVMLVTVAGNKYSIGYVSLGSLSDDVKTVNIDGAVCSNDTVKNGDYKIFRSFNICYSEDNLSDVALDFVNYIMSVEGQQIIEKNGYISIDTSSNYSSTGLSGKITLAGSTSVAPVMDKLKDAYQLLNPNVKIEIQESGSSAGIQSVTENAVDIGMSSRELSNDEASKLVSKQIALDGIAVIVNKNNPINNFTSEQVKSIYLAEFTDWSEIN